MAFFTRIEELVKSVGAQVCATFTCILYNAYIVFQSVIICCCSINALCSAKAHCTVTSTHRSSAVCSKPVHVIYLHQENLVFE
jgi:hypothetical protein